MNIAVRQTKVSGWVHNQVMNAPVIEVEELTIDQGREMVGRIVAERFGVGLDEFLICLDRGDYDGLRSSTLHNIIAMLPFVR